MRVHHVRAVFMVTSWITNKVSSEWTNGAIMSSDFPFLLHLYRAWVVAVASQVEREREMSRSESSRSLNQTSRSFR